MSNSSVGKKFIYTKKITDLLRLIRNLDEHPNKRYVFTCLSLPWLRCWTSVSISEFESKISFRKEPRVWQEAL